MGGHTIKTWSKTTQALIALSSGESELYATLKASAETLGLISMMQDFGVKVAGEVWGDAQAALGFINRNDLGKTRHIQTGLLWVQQVAAGQRLKYGTVLGKVNPVDLCTKYLNWNTIEHYLRKLKFEFIEGRAAEAPKLEHVSMSVEEYNMMGLWRPWRWLDVITKAMKKESAKPRMSVELSTCAGEINAVSGRFASLEQSVLQGTKRQVQGYNGSNNAQLRRAWGSTQALPPEHGRVKHP